MGARTKLFALLMALALFVVACGGDGGGETDTGDTDTGTDTEESPEPTDEGDEGDEGEDAAAGEGGSLLIWADDTRRPALEPVAQEWGEANGVEVTIEEVQFDEIRDQFATAAPAGEGPDVIVGAHDWLGQLVEGGVVAPIDLGGREGDFEQVAIDAFTYDGQLYGLPYSVENIALFRNTDVVPEAPGTFEELVEMANEAEESGEVEHGFLIPTDPPDPYHNYPLFTANGGYVFGFTEGEGYDANDLGIDSEGGLAAAEQFSQWVQDGFIEPGVSGSIMQEQFGEGNAAFAITGPWALVQDGRGFEETDVNFEVSPIPPLEGGTPQPFVGVQGFMVSAFSENELLAQTFLTEAMATEDLQLALFEANSRPPALSAAQEQIGDDPVFAAFGEAGADGLPMPAIPQMGSVWESWTNAYALIYNQDGDPQEAMQNAADQIRTLIDGDGDAAEGDTAEDGS